MKKANKTVEKDFTELPVQEATEIDHLKNIIEEKQSSKNIPAKSVNHNKLVFSDSGELIITSTPQVNDVVVDQIYKDGFFNPA